jgi:translation initiation factor IF-3
VRLIDAEGEQAGIKSIFDARAMAEESGLDLVEISATSTPPVCRIMDYGKFQFQQNKQKHAARKNQKQMQLKEIKFRPGTEDADYQVKLRKTLGFLEEGNKVKITLRFKGREMSHQELGMKMLKRMEADTVELSQVESHPKKEGRQMVMVLGPKKKS